MHHSELGFNQGPKDKLAQAPEGGINWGPFHRQFVPIIQIIYITVIWLPTNCWILHMAQQYNCSAMCKNCSDPLNSICIREKWSSSEFDLR